MPDSQEQRLVELESLVMHLQNDLEQMHQVILQQQKELEALRRQIEKLEGRVEIAEQGPEERDPLQELPPHF